MLVHAGNKKIVIPILIPYFTQVYMYFGCFRHMCQRYHTDHTMTSIVRLVLYMFSQNGQIAHPSPPQPVSYGHGCILVSYNYLSVNLTIKEISKMTPNMYMMTHVDLRCKMSGHFIALP